MAVAFDEQGQRHRSWKSVCDESSEDAWEDWPVRGPRTVQWVARFIERAHRTPTNHHTTWRSLCRLQATDAGVAEHETLCRALEALGSYDQINVCNSAAAEVLVRKLQVIEEKHRDRLLQNTGGAVDDDVHLFLGTEAGTRGGACVCPALQGWIAEELARESAILKERRKAREERQLARPKAAPKGGARGAGDGG